MRSASKGKEYSPNLRVTRNKDNPDDINPLAYEINSYQRVPDQDKNPQMAQRNYSADVNERYGNPQKNENEGKNKLRAAIEGETNDEFNQKAAYQQQQNEKINTNSLKLLVKFVEYLKVKGDNETPTLIILQERLIYTASYLLEKGADIQDLPFDFESETTQFVQKVNLRAMEGGTKLSFEELIILITKAIDILLYKPVCSRIKLEKLLELRILCFNNLSCIYRQRKMFSDALKAVNKAVEMEEVLRKNNYSDSTKTIASTYINRSVIMSELGMHLESIDTIKQALGSMDEYKKQWESSLEERDAFQLKYLSVIAYFNLAVEHEHLFYTQYAKSFYEIALGLSQELNYTEMTTNIEAALKKMKKVPKK